MAVDIRHLFTGVIPGVGDDEQFGWVLVTIATAWFFLIGIRVMIPALLPFITREFAITLTTAGFLVTILYGIYALCQFPGGLIGDKLGERMVLVLGVGLATVALALLALPFGLIPFVIGLILFGIGSALFAPTRLTVLSDLFPNNSGTAIGITLTAGNVGNTILPALAGIVAVSIGWRFGFVLALPFLIIVCGGLWFTIPSRTSEPMAVDALSASFLGRMIETITERRVYWLTALLIIVEFTWGAMSGLYTTYLVVVKDVPESSAAILLGIFFGWGIIINILAGASSDRFGAKRPLIVLFGIAVIGFWALTVVDGLVSLVLVTLALSSILGGYPIIFPHLNHQLPSDVQGSGLGLIRTGYMAIGATGPVIMGAIGDAGIFDYGFLMLAGMLLVGIVLTVTLPDA